MPFILHDELSLPHHQRNLKKYIVKSAISLADWALHFKCKKRFFWLNCIAQSCRKINCIHFICIGGHPALKTQTYKQVTPPQQNNIHQLSCSSCQCSAVSKCKIIAFSPLALANSDNGLQCLCKRKTYKNISEKLFLPSIALLEFFSLDTVLGHFLNMKKHTWKITTVCTVNPLVICDKIGTIA